jgi:Tfp pilus assembly protein PilZ
MAKGVDKRKSVRVPVDFEVRFTFGTQEHIAQALNLSTDGMFIKTSYMLLQGDIIEVYFHRPDIEEPFWLKARVAWGTWIEGMNMPTSGMGIQFIDPLPKQREQLKNYLRGLIQN